jgi:hypothetical protein
MALWIYFTPVAGLSGLRQGRKQDLEEKMTFG